MNRFAKCLALAGLVLAACGGGTTQTNNPAYNLGYTGTVQGVVADAVTGKRVGGDLKLYLIQGATVRGPSRLITSGSDPLQGEYAFTGVPVEFNTNNARWKIVATATGYQRFESEFTFDGKATVTGGGSGFIDTVYNKIGNIFLFPTGSVAPGYSFTVLYNGKPVPNATVELDPSPGDNSAKFSVTSAANDTLFAFTGYVSSLQYTTNASGVATAPGTDLVLGGAYNVSVLPTTFTDSGGSKVQTALTGGPGITVGFSGNDTNQTINITDAVGASSGVPLYIASESNPPPNQQLQADGSLTIVFNAPVTLVNPQCFGASVARGQKADLSGPGAGAVPGAPTTGPNGTPQVAATLSSDGLTLTLKPLYCTASANGCAATDGAPATTDRNVSITYTDGPPISAVAACGAVAGGTPQGAFVVPKDYPAQAFTLFAGGTVVKPAPNSFGCNASSSNACQDSGVVHITGP